MHKFIELRALLLVEHTLAISSQKVTECFLLVGIHLHITEGQNLIVRQEFDRWFGHSVFDPLDKDILNLTMRAICNFARIARYALWKLQDYALTHIPSPFVLLTGQECRIRRHFGNEPARAHISEQLLCNGAIPGYKSLGALYWS